MSKVGFTEAQVRSFEACGICHQEKEVVGIYFGTIICDDCLNDVDGSEENED